MRYRDRFAVERNGDGSFTAADYLLGRYVVCASMAAARKRIAAWAR